MSFAALNRGHTQHHEVIFLDTTLKPDTGALAIGGHKNFALRAGAGNVGLPCVASLANAPQRHDVDPELVAWGVPAAFLVRVVAARQLQLALRLARKRGCLLLDQQRL